MNLGRLLSINPYSHSLTFAGKDLIASSLSVDPAGWRAGRGITLCAVDFSTWYHHFFFDTWTQVQSTTIANVSLQTSGNTDAALNPGRHSFTSSKYALTTVSLQSRLAESSSLAFTRNISR